MFEIYSVSFQDIILLKGATQLRNWLTLSNGFTYVELFKSRNEYSMILDLIYLSFFSNGVDPEYAVIGRVVKFGRKP
jgi:hypothetical protein